MSEAELFFNKLGIKLISKNIKLSDLKEEDINVYFIDRNKRIGLDLEDIETFDKQLLDGLVLNYGGLNAIVKVESLLNDIRITREKLGNSLASLNLWILLVSLREFKKRLEKLCIIDIERILLKAFLHYTNKHNEIILEDFISSFGNKKIDEEEVLGLDKKEEDSYYTQTSLLEEVPKKEKYVASPLVKAISRRQNSSNALFKMLSKANMLLEFIEFGCDLTDALESKGTPEAQATAKVISAAIKDIIESSTYQIKKNDKNIPGQITLEQVII